MIAPMDAAHRLLWSLAVGVALGFFYGFLRPLRPKLTALADLIFVAAAFYGWLYIGFGVCGGDLRFGCTVAMGAGGVAWEIMLGRWLQPVFRGFWHILSKTAAFFLLPLKIFLENIQKIIKFLLASGKKWFTMKNNRQSNQPTSGGRTHGKKKNEDQAGVQKIQSHHKSGAVGGSGAVHHRTGDPPRLHRRKPQSV
jgi:hypothetical protein